MMDRSQRWMTSTRFPVLRRMTGLLLVLGTAASGCGGEQEAPRDRETVAPAVGRPRPAANAGGAEIERYLTAAGENWNFHGTVLVARGNDVILETGLGSADLDEHIPNGLTTRFQIASVTKVFTAAAVMRLVQEGKIGLDETVSRYLPEYEGILGKDITVGHLLSHSSGLPEFAPDAGRANVSRAIEPRAMIEDVRGHPPLFAPGLEARYSNLGYVLLGLLIEAVTGESYNSWLDSRVLKPLGMSGTGVDPDYPSPAGFAKGYVEDRTGLLRPAPFVHPSWAFSAGALYSTVGDLHRFDRALSSPGFLTAASLEMMFRPRNRTFALGWLVGSVFGRRFEAHGGGAPGFSAWIERWPDDDVFVAVLSNVTRAPAGEIGRSLAAAVFGEAYVRPAKRVPVFVSSADLQDFAGRYRLENGDVRSIVLEGGALVSIRGEGPKYPIVPYAEDSFFFAGDKGAFIRFERDAAGRVTGLVFHQLGIDEPAQKI